MRLLNFGQYKRKSFEWAFFYAPSYVHYIHDEDTEGRWKWHNREDEIYFNELYRRASRLTGICPFCKQRPITRMCLLYNRNWQSVSSASFDCDECGYLGGAPCEYAPPSLFPRGHALSQSEYKIIAGAIKHQFIGPGRLTQTKMEAFFQADRFFRDATPGYFDAAGVHGGDG